MNGKNPLFILLTLLAFLPLVASAAMQAGSVKAVRVSGDVLLSDASGTKLLEDGMIFGQGSSIKTANNGMAVLAFANGSTITVKASTVFRVDEFMQEPFQSRRSFADLSADPSQSSTRGFLERGEVAFNVKKLRPESNFEIFTPIGAAGVRGTAGTVAFNIVNGERVMVVTNANGVVETKAVGDGISETAWQELPQGTAIDFILDASGTLTLSPPAGLSNSQRQAILQAAGAAATTAGQGGDDLTFFDDTVNDIVLDPGDFISPTELDDVDQ